MDSVLSEESKKEEEVSLKEADAAAVSVPPSHDVPTVSETEFLQPKPSVPVVDTPRAPLHPSLPPKTCFVGRISQPAARRYAHAQSYAAQEQ